MERALLRSNCGFLTAKITQEENQDTWLVFQGKNGQGEEFALYFKVPTADSAVNSLITEVSGEVFLCDYWRAEKSPLSGFGHIVS